MLIKVANDDVKSFKQSNKWLAYHPNESLIFKDLPSVWMQLDAAYNGSFRDLVYGDFPDSESILHTLEKSAIE